MGRALFAFLAVPLLATPAVAACGMPEITAPAVPYEIYVSTPEWLSHWCPGARYSCSYPSPTWFQPQRYAILINQDLSDEDKVCSLAYEKGHLPPNNWHTYVIDKPQQLSVPALPHA